MGVVLKKNSDNLALGAQVVRAVEEVYVGDAAPTEDKGYKVWINPEGEAGGSFDVDLSNYYTKEEVDNKLKDVDVDLTGYATEEYVNSAIDGIEIPDTSAFQTEEDVKSLIDAALEEVENGAY
jgi:hypothetical protein